MRDHDHRGRARAVILGLEQPALRRAHPEGPKEPGSQPAHGHAFRGGDAGQRGAPVAGGTEGLEGALLLRDRLDVDDGQRPLVAGRAPLVDPHQLLRIRIRKPGEQDPVHHREDRGGRAQTQAEHGDHGEGQAGVAPERAQRIACIRDELVEREHPARLAYFVFDPLDTAEGGERFPPGVGAARARAGFRLALDVKTQLLVELALQAPAEEQGLQALEEIRKRAHASPSASCTWRIPLTAPETRCQSDVSAAS